MWFQHDGVPAHISAVMRSASNTAYPRRWIRWGGSVNWPARSPDLSCLDFFLWGHIKSLVYTSPVDSDEALVTRIADVAGDTREIPGVFVNPLIGYLPPEKLFRKRFTLILLFPSKMQQTSILSPF
ncbi:uncharacterized protein TNCV_830711 [Trichonephila clavipes]|nr:uncharacterized protein TNCV_830711 [Trichonephila clavipes]